MEAIRNLKFIKDNWSAYNEWEKREFENSTRVKHLRNRKAFSKEELDNAKNYGKTIIDAINIADQISVNKTEKAMVSAEAGLSIIASAISSVGALSSFVAAKILKLKNPKITGYIGYKLGALAAIIFEEFMYAHYEKKSARISRYQTRKKELGDVRNFVLYNKEQVAQAKEIAKDIGPVVDVTKDLTIKDSLNGIETFKKSLKVIKDLKKDYAHYRKWYQKYKIDESTKEERFAKINLDEDKLAELQKDRDNISYIIKKLELASTGYELNAELGSKLAGATLSFIALGGGLLMASSLAKSAKKMTQNPLLAKTEKILSNLSIPLGIGFLILFSGIFVKLTEDAARLGRFREQNNMLKNPQKFVQFSEKEKERIKDIPIKYENKKSFFTAVIGGFKELLKIKKDIKEYRKYSNKELQEELKCKKALKKVPVSQKQLDDAKKLQFQLFKAFEKIDDKSESFVDDMSAAVDSITSLCNGTICTLADLLTLELFAKKISQHTKTKEMPGFVEGFKMMKNLKKRDLTLIFLAPFFVTRILITLVTAIGVEVKKKACKIGVFAALKDLENPKNFLYDKNQKMVEKIDTFRDFIKVD